MKVYSKLRYDELMNIDISDIKDYREVDSFLEVLWSEFSNVPVDEDTDTIDESFYIWNKGTDKMDIWHWFDDNYSKGLAEGLMGLGLYEQVSLNDNILFAIIENELKDADEKAKDTLFKSIRYLFSDLIIGKELVNRAEDLNEALEKYVFDRVVEYMNEKGMSIDDFWNSGDDTEVIDYIYS